MLNQLNSFANSFPEATLFAERGKSEFVFAVEQVASEEMPTFRDK